MSETEDKSDRSSVEPFIWLSDATLIEVCEQIEDALVANDTELFQRRGEIFWKSAEGVVKVDATLLRVRAMKVAIFAKRSKAAARVVIVDPPLKYFHTLLRMRGWKFPRTGPMEA